MPDGVSCSAWRHSLQTFCRISQGLEYCLGDGKVPRIIVIEPGHRFPLARMDVQDEHSQFREIVVPQARHQLLESICRPDAYHGHLQRAMFT
jgi:hypothetical protein